MTDDSQDPAIKSILLGPTYRSPPFTDVAAASFGLTSTTADKAARLRVSEIDQGLCGDVSTDSFIITRFGHLYFTKGLSASDQKKHIVAAGALITAVLEKYVNIEECES